MSFSRANSIGWALNEVLTSAQMNQIDINQSRALDGNAGGTYAPSTPIIIGGSGLKTTALELSAGGVTTIDHPVTVRESEGASIDMRGANGFLPGITTALGVARTIRRQQPVMLGWSPHENNWARDSVAGGSPLAGFGASWIQVGVGTVDDPDAGQLWIPIANLVDLSQLTKVRVWLTGKANASVAGHALLPLTRPKVAVYCVNSGATPGPSISLLSTQVEDSAVMPAYDTPHFVECTLTSPEDIDESASENAYFIQVTGEHGTNSVADTTSVFAAEAFFSVSKLTPGG